MRNKALLLIVPSLVLAVSTITLGSNMGFKISIPLKADVPNYVSLPYCTSYTDARLLFADIPNCQQVARMVPGTGRIEHWPGPRARNFRIRPGEAYVVRVRRNCIWVVVGSHDPRVQIVLKAGGPNLVSIPYNTRALTANALLAEIPSATRIAAYDPKSGQWRECSQVQPASFALEAGDGLLVYVQHDSLWVPSHF